MALKTVNYVQTVTLGRTTQAVSTYQCDWDEAPAMMALLMSSADTQGNTGLLCNNVVRKWWKNEWTSNLAELTATYVPPQVIAAQTPGAPMKFRFQFHNESFSIKGPAWHWQGNSATIDTKTTPLVYEESITDVILYGTRNTVDLMTYGPFGDKVNNAPFMGAGVERVLFKSASVTPRQIGNGQEVFDVEINLQYRIDPWTSVYDDVRGLWDDPVGPHGEALYDSCDFSTLFTQ